MERIKHLPMQHQRVSKTFQTTSQTTPPEISPKHPKLTPRNPQTLTTNKVPFKKKKDESDAEPEHKPEPETTQKEEIQEKNVESYKMQMTDLERKTMLIAQDHLGTSFNMEKSTGYLKYLET